MVRQEQLEQLAGCRDEGRRRELCGALVEAILADVRRDQGRRDPLSLLRWTAARYDELVRALFDSAGVPPAALLCVVALGGYGRGELFPCSDLDLLVLFEGDAGELAEGLVERIVYPLWDARVRVGHAVRGIDASLELAGQDLTLRTALLDARLVCGDEGPFHALQAGATREFFGPQRVAKFVAALQQERARRHERFGHTEYLLEPNVKHGKGGLRDLNTGLWALRSRFEVSDLGEAVEHGLGTPRQARALAEAREFLCRLRLAMHLEAGRAEDNLRFELQETLAPRLCPEVELPGITRRVAPAVAPAVERLMHALYRHTRAVVLETDGILERCSAGADRPAGPGRPVTPAPDEHLQRRGRRIHSADPQRFWEAPAELVRVFEVALRWDLALDRATRDAVAEAAADRPGRQLMVDPGAAEGLLRLLCHPEREGGATILEQMHHLGVLGAMIPEFEPCTGRIQHDLYHVYTVDLHSLYVVALLKSWRRGERGDACPTALDLAGRLDQPESLMLAALLHDVGKPLGQGHADKGARLALGVAARIGLGAEQQRRVGFLVEQHLTMAHLSQRRDLSDPEVIGSFAELVEDVDRLRELYLLTAADTAMTAPGNLGEWKASLLDELYSKAYLRLRRGARAARRQLARQLAGQRDALEEALAAEGDAGGEGETSGARLVARIPDELLLAVPRLEDLLRHLRLVQQLERQPGHGLRVARRQRPNGTTEVTVACHDSPGRLADITGVMAAHRIEVLGANVYTLTGAGSEPGGEGAGTVLDVFVVRAPERSHDPWPAFERELAAALRGELSVEQLVARATRSSGLLRKVTPRVPVEVVIDNEASGRLTVLDIQAPDRPGTLHRITRCISGLGLAIRLSKIATEAGRVVDSFYVSDARTGGKVTERGRLERIGREVAASIEGEREGAT